MTTTLTAGARHRAARRPSTPLTVALSSTGARRGFAAVASSGLVLTMAATSATAANSETNALQNVDLTAATTEAITAMVTTPTVSVDADAEFDVENYMSAEATPAPEPEPEPEPEPAPEPAPVVERSTDTASRTSERTEIQDQPAEAAPAEAAAAEPEPAPAPAASASGSAIVNVARQYIGVPYVYGGATPAGFDCSGFTQYVYAQVGISLPRSSSAQGSVGYRVSASEARPGDLVWGPGHVGIYTGNGQHIAARSPGTALYESPIYLSNPVFIRVG